MSEPYRIEGRAIERDRLLAVPVHIGGRPYELMVDTGATHTALLPVVINDQLRLEQLRGVIEQYTLGRATTTTTPFYLLPTLGLGEFTITELEIIPLHWPGRFQADGILGMDCLSSFSRVCLDFMSPALELHLEE